MSMPKGYKSEHGYATVTSIKGGMGYREIAEEMTGMGFKMNHSTARNIFIKAMRKLATPLHELYGVELDKKTVADTAKDPRFQEGVIEILEGHINTTELDI